MKSRELFNEAQRYLVGGVNSPVRAFRSVGSQPFFTRSADGSKLITEDGDELIDFVCSWGPALFGHNNVRIKEAIKNALENGTSFGTPSELEIKIAKLIKEFIPSAELIRMTNSGTEATMSCIRLARGFTNRDKIVKFSGCYHGHVDSLLVKAGSGALTFGYPDSAGVPSDLAKLTIVLPFNDFQAVEDCFKSEGENIAAIILEPYPANVGLIIPENNFLKFLRDITKKYASLLIFDEVITGFRIGKGGAQGRENIMPDLTALGKIIGGGLPVGAFCGRRDIMEHIAPLGPVYQAGTLSGNPLAMSAGIAAMELIKEQNPYQDLKIKSEYVVSNLKSFAREKGIALQVPIIESLFSFFFNENEVKNYNDALKSSTDIYKKFFIYCLQNGVYLAPSAFESCFMSVSHSKNDLDRVVEVFSRAMKNI